MVLVKNFFSVLTRKRIRRGTFHFLVDLQAAIKHYLTEHNKNPKPFVWTASAASILAKLGRLPASCACLKTRASRSAWNVSPVHPIHPGTTALPSGEPADPLCPRRYSSLNRAKASTNSKRIGAGFRPETIRGSGARILVLI
jgi:hypothetical protein